MAGNKRKVGGNFQKSDLLDWIERGYLWEDGKLKSRNGFHGKLKNEYQLISCKITYLFALRLGDYASKTLS